MINSEDTLLAMLRELGVRCLKDEKTILLPYRGRINRKQQQCIDALVSNYKYNIQTFIPAPLKRK